MTGVALSGLVSTAGDTMTGLTVSAYNRVTGNMNGISLGIINYAHTLYGFQIGLINYVRDNPKYIKLLPLINANFP